MEDIKKKKTQKYTFEEVWQGLMENREQLQKLADTVSEQSKQIFGVSTEKDESWRTEKDEIWRLVKENSKLINGISKSNGDMAEDTVYNSLEQDMTFAGINFDFIARNWKKHSKKLNMKSEYDVILENGDTMALIETKYKVRKDDVSKLVAKETENRFRKLFPNYNNYKILLGIGGMSFDDDAIKEAKENGVGIIKVIGDKVEYYTDGIKIY